MAKPKPVPEHEDEYLVCKSPVRDDINDTKLLFDENGKQYPPRTKRRKVLLDAGVYDVTRVYNSGGTYSYFFAKLGEDGNPVWFSYKTYELFIQNSPDVAWEKKCKYMPRSSS